MNSKIRPYHPKPNETVYGIKIDFSDGFDRYLALSHNISCGKEISTIRLIDDITVRKIAFISPYFSGSNVVSIIYYRDNSDTINKLILKGSGFTASAQMYDFLSNLAAMLADSNELSIDHAIRILQL